MPPNGVRPGFRDRELMEEQWNEAASLLNNATKNWDPTDAATTQSIITASHVLYRLARHDRVRLEDAAGRISRPYGQACQERRAGSEASPKKLAAIPLATVLFRVYFALNNTRLAASILSPLGNSELLGKLDEREVFRASDVAAFSYYQGRLALEKFDFDESGRALSRALVNCRRGTRQHRLVLFYYVLTRMITDRKVPSRAYVSSEDCLAPLRALVMSVRAGDINAFNNTLATYANFWKRTQMLFTITIHLRLLIYCSLLKRVVKVCAEDSRLPISAFVVACRFQGESDEAAVQCALVGLVHKGFVKAYLSNEHGMLVLSKKNPFP